MICLGSLTPEVYHPVMHLCTKHQDNDCNVTVPVTVLYCQTVFWQLGGHVQSICIRFNLPSLLLLMVVFD